MAEAAAEASIFETVTTPPTGYVEGAHTFEAAPPLAGSIYPGRLAYDPAFLATEVFTEELAALPTAVKQAMGYSVGELILNCQYAETPCNMNRLAMHDYYDR